MNSPYITHNVLTYKDNQEGKQPVQDGIWLLTVNIGSNLTLMEK